jgi:hypothetical protein
MSIWEGGAEAAPKCEVHNVNMSKNSIINDLKIATSNKLEEPKGHVKSNDEVSVQTDHLLPEEEEPNQSEISHVRSERLSLTRNN